MLCLLIVVSLFIVCRTDSYDYYGTGGVGVQGCCECTESSNEPYCNDECDNIVCEYDQYCCNEEYGSWDSICANWAVAECDGTAGYDYGGDDNYGYDYYGPCGYDNYEYGNEYSDDYYGEEYEQCNCDEICYGQESEDWEFEYEEVPQCIIENCGQQLDACASDDSCVEGIEGMVSSCYADNQDPMQCMDGLVQDTENNGFNELCDGDTECGADLNALGSCVVNSANYGFCPEEEYKKLKLKSVLKTVKKRSRQRKRKSAAAKQKLKRRSRRSKLKKRGKRASKLRKSRRKLQGDGSDYYYDDYENPEYDYGCYCDCGDEGDEIPDCVVESCGQQLEACGQQIDCINGVEGVKAQCYENNDSPQECMDELMQESNGAQAIELCNGNEQAAGDLQALGTCVINSANYGMCSEDEYKKFKIKALVKATKKARARKAASKQRKARSSKRARSAKAQRSRKRQRSRKVRARSRRAVAQRQRQRRARSQRAKRVRSQRSRKVKSKKARKSRRSLQSVGACCECMEESDDPHCNDECDNTICSYDPYCCNEDYGSWDSLCVSAAVKECDGTAQSYDDYGGFDDSYQGGFEYDYGTGGCDSYYNYGYEPDSFYDGGAGYTFDSYNDGGYEFDPNSYQFEDSYGYGGYTGYGDYSGTAGGVYDYDYDYYAPSSDDYYDIDGNNYNYDYYGGCENGEDSYSYQPPSKKQRQRRQRPRSRSRVSKQQRRARAVKRERHRARRQRVRRARR